MSFVSDYRRGKRPKPQRTKAIELIKEQLNRQGFVDTKTVAWQTGYSQRWIEILTKEVLNPNYVLKVKYLRKLIGTLKRCGFQVEVSKEAFSPEQIDQNIEKCKRFLENK